MTSKALSRSAFPTPTSPASGGSRSRTPTARRRKEEPTCSMRPRDGETSDEVNRLATTADEHPPTGLDATPAATSPCARNRQAGVPSAVGTIVVVGNGSGNSEQPTA